MEKYYTPKEEDLHIGYICEYRCVKISGVGIKEYHDWKPITIDWGWLTYDEEIQFRTKYLDSENIEKEGWESEQYTKNKEICLQYKYKDWHLVYWFGETPYIELTKDEYDTNYQGQCKSINEFRKICKWLNIK
jgi:hypothetical protein